MDEYRQSNLKSIFGWSLLVFFLAVVYFFPESFGLPSIQSISGPANINLSNNTGNKFVQFNPTRANIAASPVVVPTKVTTSTQDCTLWSDIGIGQKGGTLCVQGIVYSVGTDKVAFYIKFSPSMSAFYFLSYAYIYPKVKAGDCVMSVGVVKQIGNTPVIVLDESVQPLKRCNGY